MFRTIRIGFRITLLVLAMTVLTAAAMGVVLLRSGHTAELSELVYAAIIVGAFAVAIAGVYASSLTQPLSSLDATLGMLSKGELPEKTDEQFPGELGRMQSRLNDLVSVLRENAGFAQKVGEGKFDTNFQPAGEHDTLGHALLDMRDNLAANDLKEKERNWVMLRLAEASEILRVHDDVKGLAGEITRFMIEKTGAIQGAFYVVEEESKNIDLVSCYAFSRKKYHKTSFRFAEGLVGQAVAEKDIIVRTEIPDDFVTISSGILGDKKPTSLVIMPFIANEQAYGVIELAGFSRFDNTRTTFIRELSVILARTIFNIQVNERTRKLLAESQALAADLKEKQEVLRENAEEMQATEEELRHSNVRLEEQVEEVSRTRSRMQLLLENASEVITICEADGTIRYVSPSVETILGYQPAQLQGKKDIDNVSDEQRNVYTNLFKSLAEKPTDKSTVQYEYKTSKGTFIWLETTGTNLMSNSAIHGYILNSRDITERRRAEQEQRMRSKMQALSENSMDLITRLEDGAISYINPVISTYTGEGTSAFINKKASDTTLDAGVLDRWLRIVEEVKQTGDKVLTEMDFPSAQGNRVMQVNAIPEFDETKQLESVLVVSHDITERKVIELDIRDKNKKINDSINYARRIQNAILPDMQLIRETLPDSFLLYKPRDVVSGDFPWFVKSGDNIFIAAVDCTGHGVPGALLSLIGYFLLNDIVKSRNITDPGTILDLLDEGVTQTLRQDQADAATKDGMDIALCRIDTRKKVVEYAGAHRPLLVVKGGNLEEVKGDRCPVGGGFSKDDSKFVTTKVELQSGDSIYFSSDGFPDQFGGPEGKKLGSKRVRDLVGQLQHLPADQAAVGFDQAWEGWRGDHKQTDDVLLIGVKF
jgi:PAS domain S-box-containing protein